MQMYQVPVFRFRIRIRWSEVQIRGSASGSVPKCHGSTTLVASLLLFLSNMPVTYKPSFCTSFFRLINNWRATDLGGKRACFPVRLVQNSGVPRHDGRIPAGQVHQRNRSGKNEDCRAFASLSCFHRAKKKPEYLFKFRYNMRDISEIEPDDWGLVRHRDYSTIKKALFSFPLKWISAPLLWFFFCWPFIICRVLWVITVM